MKIEVLYVQDCPHRPAAIVKLKEVLAAEGIAADILEVAVDDMATAKALRFCGSPTIRINGRDVAAELGNVRDFAVSRRRYPDSKEPGVPPLEMNQRAVCGVQRAVEEAAWGKKLRSVTLMQTDSESGCLKSDPCRLGT